MISIQVKVLMEMETVPDGPLINSEVVDYPILESNLLYKEALKVYQFFEQLKSELGKILKVW